MYIGLIREVAEEDLAAGGFLSSVETNSCFRFVFMEIFNKDGSVASRCVYHNTLDYSSTRFGTRIKKIDLRKFSYDLFDGLVSGGYTFVLTAGIPAGEAELARVDFTYSK